MKVKPRQQCWLSDGQIGHLRPAVCSCSIEFASAITDKIQILPLFRSGKLKTALLIICLAALVPELPRIKSGGQSF